MDEPQKSERETKVEKINTSLNIRRVSKHQNTDSNTNGKSSSETIMEIRSADSKETGTELTEKSTQAEKTTTTINTSLNIRRVGKDRKTHQISTNNDVANGNKIEASAPSSSSTQSQIKTTDSASSKIETETEKSEKPRSRINTILNIRRVKKDGSREAVAGNKNKDNREKDDKDESNSKSKVAESEKIVEQKEEKSAHEKESESESQAKSSSLEDKYKTEGVVEVNLDDKLDANTTRNTDNSNGKIDEATEEKMEIDEKMKEKECVVLPEQMEAVAIDDDVVMVESSYENVC